jgi:hypothetical protein
LAKPFGESEVPAKATISEARASFLKKRSKKLLIISASALSGRLSPGVHSFLVLFFKKEPLPFT